MLGILIGTVCLVGLIKLARRGRYGYGYGHGCGGRGGFGRHHHGHWGHFGGPGQGDGFGGPRGFGGGGGWGPGFFLRGLFERLETTPGQEKVIKQAIGELMDTMKQARGEWVDMTDLALLLTGETFDATAAEGLSGKADASFAKVRVAMVEALRKVHEALDENQRKQLSDWLRSRAGRGGGPFGGGFRQAAWM